MKQKQSAGQTRKSHKSRKTAPEADIASVSAGEPSLPVLATSLPVPTNDLALILASPGKGEKTEAPGADTGVPQVEAKKQWWFREPDSKSRKFADKIFVMRAAGRDAAYIAKKLDTTEGTVRQTVYIARKNGWVDDADETVDLEVELALDIDRKVVRNISASLDGQMTNWQTHEMTIAAAKGRGHFKNHEVSKNDGPPPMSVVAIQVIMPSVGAADQRPEVLEDQMGGVPAYLDCDVEEVE